MPECSDPTRSLQLALKRRTIVGIAIICVTGVWAFWPIRSHPGQSNIAARAIDPKPPKDVRWTVPGPELTRAANLDLKPFEGQLWKVPSRPVQIAEAPAPPPPIPPPPLKLQLIAIVRSGDRQARDGSASELQAALFDSETNRLYKVAPGSAIQRYRIKAITADTVELVDAQFPAAPVHVLKMRSIDPKAAAILRSPSTRSGKPEPVVPSPMESPSASAGEIAEGGHR